MTTTDDRPAADTFTPHRSTHGVGTRVLRQEGMLMPAVLWELRISQVLALNVDYFSAEQAEALAAVLEYPTQREKGKRDRRNFERRTAAGLAIPLRLTELAQQ
jgi:hypothetical protein